MSYVSHAVSNLPSWKVFAGHSAAALASDSFLSLLWSKKTSQLQWPWGLPYDLGVLWRIGLQKHQLKAARAPCRSWTWDPSQAAFE